MTPAKVPVLLVGFGPVMQKDIDPSTAGGQYDGKTFTFTIPPHSDPSESGLDERRYSSER